MALNRPNKAEQVVIIRNICHDNTGDESRYKAFLSFYRSIACNLSSQDNFITIDKSAFNSHDELLSAVDKLRENATMTRTVFQDHAFQSVVREEQERGAGIVSHVAFLTNCTTKDQHSQGYRVDKYLPMKWESSETYLDFLRRAFPVSASSIPHHFPGKSKLKAWKLKKRYKLTLLPTSDLAQHLLYDSEARTIHISHQVAFLKAQLRFIKANGYDMNMNFEDSVKLGTLPPQLLFETLYSIYDILFPVDHDKKSSKLVKKLTRGSKFDSDLAVFDGGICDFLDDFEYCYWGERLTKVREIISHPPPANKMIAWLERHTSERNALTVAILGLFLSALFGLLGLLVGIAQLVVSIYAWKCPTAQPSS